MSTSALPKVANDTPHPQILPHSIEAEQGLLGSLLANNAGVDKIADFLEAKHFCHPTHGRIYDAIIRTVDRGDIASPVRLKAYFEKEQALEAVGGTRYLVELATEVPMLNTAEDYAQQIFELYQRRSLIEQCQETMSRAYNRTVEETAQDIIENHESRLYELAEHGLPEKETVSFGASVAAAIKIAEAAYTKSGPVGISTGLSNLDNALGGLHPTDLLILAARPSMGKTALASNIAFNTAKRYLETNGKEGAIVGFFSLEMGHTQLTTRILGGIAGVSGDAVRRGNLKEEEFHRLVQVGNQYRDLPLHTEDTSALSITALRTRARRMKRQHGITLLIVDYLQLLNGSATRRAAENRVQEVSEISRGLKTIAKELDIPVIALSQLSRALEGREDKRPQLADLRESGSIEQDADVVMFVYRDEYYLSREEPSQRGNETPEKFQERYYNWQTALESSKNVTEIIVAKQRHGPIGTAKLYFDPNLTQFRDLETSREW